MRKSGTPIGYGPEHGPQRPTPFPGNALARVTLVLLVLGTAPSVSFSQDAMGGGAARDWEQQVAEARRARAEQLGRMQQSRAHAQMPDTMYASTPDPTTPPHPFPLDAGLKSGSERSGPPPGMSARSAMRQTHRIGLFPAAANALGRQGFARVINHSESDGEVTIDAYDDDGAHYGPLTLAMAAGETAHFNSDDLEEGNAGKGLDGTTGPPGKGDWRLELSSTLELQVLSYIRTDDGFLTSMHDFVARTESGQHRVAIFNPGRNSNQVSWLRLTNPGEGSTEVRIEGIDDGGQSPGSAVVLSLEGGMSRTLSAKDLEAGTGVSGGLGTGKGKWRLVVSSDALIEVLNTLSTPTGHLTNLSTVPGPAGFDDGGAAATYRIGLFPSAANALRRQGFARVINRSDSDGEVKIDAWDDDGAHHGPLTLAIGAGETVHFNSDDLEEGNVRKGLDGATGPPGKGDWRLELSSTLELQVLSYIRTDDGFLTSMHDFVARTESGQHRVAIFNPGRNSNQVSRLRLTNPGEERTEVRIEGIDDGGQSPGSAVVLSLEGGMSRTLSAKDLEAGTGVSGGLGTGEGKWRLVVSSDALIEVLNTLSTPTGHLTNLSTVPGPAVSAETAADVFREHISGPVVQSKCIACHVEGGLSGHTRLVFVRDTDPDHEAHNLEEFEEFLDEVDDGASYILNKIQGVAHGGGVQVAAGTPEYTYMERFLGLLGEDIKPVALTPQTLFDTVRMAPAWKTLRRAALIFAGRIPTDEEYAAVAGGDTTAPRAAIRGLMTGPEFHEFLIRASNDRLLTDREAFIGDGFVDYIAERYRRAVKAHESGDDQDFDALWDWDDHVHHGVRRAPLELIAHVVENDLPYTEILTADYIMANPMAAASYGASTPFDDPEDVHEFKPSRYVSYYRPSEGLVIEYDPVVEEDRVISTGPLLTDYPHAGILNTKAFLERYPSTATNRNRARSRWTYYHFLGLDIEKSASRTTDPVALADTNNPTMVNPACTVCHTVMDPVAGAFQNYGDEGLYRDKHEGRDSLDDFYKYPEFSAFDIQADAWEDRQTFSIKAWLDQDSILGFDHMNNNYCDDNGECHTYGRDLRIDRIAVREAGSGALVRTVDWALLDEHCMYDGQYNAGTGDDDHYQWWGWGCDIPLGLPASATYVIEVVAWADQYGDAWTQMGLRATPYQEGDTWYRDMRVPGFAGEEAAHSDNSVQWLAQRIVDDARFAEATVEFWWPAIMGREVAEPPEDEGDADFEGLLLGASAQGAEVERLARGFRQGFRGNVPYNLKDLLVEIVLSDWFRADAVEDVNPVRRVALRDAGARRLLIPEELDHKTAALTGVKWGRSIDTDCGPECKPHPSRLSDDYRLLYGDIDSDGITERARDMTSVMAGVAKRHAAHMSCPIVMRELYLLPDAQRRLFAGIDHNVTPTSEFSATFEIGTRWPRREALSLNGALRAGSSTVKLTFTNDFWREDLGGRHVYLDRLDVRNAAGRVVSSRQLETLGPSGDCNHANNDHYALWCAGSLEVPIEITSAGRYDIEIVTGARLAGDELPRLNIVVESDAEGSAGSRAIRNKLVELHDALLGVQVTPHSPDVEAAYRLFVEVMERGREAQEKWFPPFWECPIEDIFYFEGILDDTVMWHENMYGEYYDIDWDRVVLFLDSIDWSDPHHAAQAWIVVLAYLMTDYRYLYL